MIVIIDYNTGNIGSLKNMLKKIGIEAVVSSDISEINKAEKLILPGVGSFDTGMGNLKKMEILPVLNKKVIEEKTPILGICLGMQLFANQSEEGKLEGLGWIDARVIKFKFNKESNFKIPHMGWNTVAVKKEKSIFNELEGESKFYFVHSYYLVCKNTEDILATTNYRYDFVSAVEKNNIIGVQFHPEKSHKYGMKLLENFVRLY